MAEMTTKTVLQIEGDDAIQTLRDLQKAADEMKVQLLQSTAALNGVSKGTEEYDKAMVEYQKSLVASRRAQKDYNEALNLTVNSSKAASDSYYALNRQLVELRKQYKNLSAEERISASGKEMLNKISDLDTRLKNLDAGMGQYQRNVGDYAGQIRSISGLFGGAGKAASSAVAGVMGFKASLDAVSATPILAMLTLLMTMLGKLKAAFTSSEEALNSITVAFSPFKSIGQATTIVFQNLANALGKVGEQITEWLERTGHMTDKMRENQRIAKEEIALRQRERDIRVENAKLEMEASEARARAAEKDKYTEQERIAFLEQYRDKEKQIADNELEIAKRQFALAEAKSQLTHDDSVAKDALADKEAALYEATTRYNSKMKELNSQMGELKNKINSVKEAAKGSVIDPYANETINEDNGDYRVEESSEVKRAVEIGIAVLDAKQKADAALIKANEETNAILARQNEEAIEAQRAEVQKRIGIMNNYASGIGAILNSVAGAWQSVINSQIESGKISEQEAEKQFGAVKALQYAVTLINTSAAVVSALSDVSPIPYAVKAINAAAALASGIAATIQIANTQMGNYGTITNAQTPASIASAPAVITNPTVTRTLTTAEDTQRLNESIQSVKVYVLESDISESQKAVKAKVAEASF